MIRKNLRKTACAFALMVLVPVTAYACEGTDCDAPVKSAAKPLNIMQFMREQAASTRVGERRAHHSSKTASKSTPAVHRTVAARPAPAPPTTAAVDSFASQGDPAVAVVASDEFNAIDAAAPSPFPETTGAAAANEPSVQVVAAAEFSDLDRKAEEASPLPMAPAPVAAAVAKLETAPAAQVSWLQWLWSAVTGTFAALATAMRQLVHL